MRRHRENGDALTAYPLAWPPGVPRTPPARRQTSRFRRKTGERWGSRPVSIAEGRDALLDELRRLGASDVILSSDLRLRKDGLPLASQRTPDDPGVAVYFVFDGVDTALACDRWTRIADNLLALAKFIEAMRGQERWVGHDMVRAAFTGFQRLPAPGETAGEDPFAFFGVTRGMAEVEIECAIRKALVKAHPDTGGTAEKFMRVKDMGDRLRAEIGAVR